MTVPPAPCFSSYPSSSINMSQLQGHLSNRHFSLSSCRTHSKNAAKCPGDNHRVSMDSQTSHFISFSCFSTHACHSGELTTVSWKVGFRGESHGFIAILVVFRNNIQKLLPFPCGLRFTYSFLRYLVIVCIQLDTYEVAVEVLASYASGSATHCEVEDCFIFVGVGFN
jgi:hypothetical protein